MRAPAVRAARRCLTRLTVILTRRNCQTACLIAVFGLALSGCSTAQKTFLKAGGGLCVFQTEDFTDCGRAYGNRRSQTEAEDQGATHGDIATTPRSPSPGGDAQESSAGQAGPAQQFSPVLSPTPPNGSDVTVSVAPAANAHQPADPRDGQPPAFAPVNDGGQAPATSSAPIASSTGTTSSGSVQQQPLPSPRVVPPATSPASNANFRI